MSNLRIHRLDEQTANAIAAGEVVERPASVVKELVENAIDAGADKIDIDIENGGIKLIRVTDNGSGIAPDDMQVAFERHATSKIARVGDLDSIESMGFRGEALASIAAVSKMVAKSRREEDENALCLTFEAGDLLDAKPCAHPVGTTMEVRELFFNTPARFKFLKSDRSEGNYIQDIVSKLALAHPEVSFRLNDQKKTLLHTPGNNDVRSVIYLLWGKEIAQGMHPIKAQSGNVTLEGFVARADLSRHNRGRQIVFVNGRFIQSQLIRSAIDEAGKTWFMKGRHPQLVINLDVPGTEVDVNVHPQKTEVRFANEREIFSLIYHGLRQRFEEISEIPQADFPDGIAKREAQKAPGRWDKIPEKLRDKVIADTKGPQRPLPQARELPGMKDPTPLERSEAPAAPRQATFPESVAGQSRPSGAKASERLHHEEQSAYFIEHREPVAVGEDVGDRPIDDLLKARLIGQAFKTYLILELGDELLFVDQHAAHERILYEHFKASRQKTREAGIRSQDLLVPVTLDVDPVEQGKAEEHREAIEREGYRFESFGPNSLILRAVPYTFDEGVDSEAAFRVVLDHVANGSLGIIQLNDDLDHDIACKAAVKAHDNLSFDEMKQILKDLTTLDNPYHCPHGRPIVTRLGTTDLEKLFKRIV